MSYLVLARKYRPNNFEDVVAQEHITRTLSNSIKNDRVGSGYLFCGPRGTGKTTTARILAKAMNCEKGPTPKPCGKCDSCREIAAGSSLDVLEIDAASNTGVDDVRSLRENVRYMPTRGGKRVYIIDEVHRLSGAAFDALLKTLEEPPPHVMFIFATTEPGKVPETILSRTQRYDFKRVSTEDLAAHLKNLAASEKIEVETEALQILARKADGSVRDSLSLLDQIAAFAGNKITVQDVIDGLGLVDREFLFEFIDTVATKDSAKVLKMIKAIIEGGTDVGDFVGELMEHLRILMIMTAADNTADLLALVDSERIRYEEQAKNFKIGDIVRLMQMTGDLSADLRSGLNERLLLEMTAVKMTQLESTVVLSQLLDQINTPAAANSDDLFGGVKKKSSSVEPQLIGNDKLRLTRKAEPEPASAPLPVSSRSVNLLMVRDSWDKFLTLLRQRSPMLSAHLAMARIDDVQENRISLAFNHAAEMAKQLVEKKENLNIISEKLRDHFGTLMSLQIILDPEGKAGDHPEAADPRKDRVTAEELIKKSERLKKLIERFDGEVVGIRKVE